ncbi:MAG: hypothetical protein ACI4O9_01295 [Akkermansia sp.]
MNRIILADIRSTNTDGRSVGHGAAVARNYAALYADEPRFFVAGGPFYRAEQLPRLLRLPFDVRHGDHRALVAVKCLINGLFLLCRSRGDTVIFQSCSVAIIVFLLALRRWNSRILLIQYYNQITESPLLRLLYRRAQRHLDGVICPLPSIGQALGRPYIVVPDYLYFAAPVPAYAKRVDFGIYGILTHGKGITDVARCFVGTPFHLAIAGRPSEALPEDRAAMQELREICRTAPNITLTEGYMSDEEYERRLSETKYMILNYRENYAERGSGCILDALYHRCPVIAHRHRSTRFVGEEGIGLLIDTAEELTPACLQHLLQPEVYAAYGEALERFLTRSQEQHRALRDFICPPCRG